MGGCKRHQLKKIGKPTSLQVTYSKRKDWLVRKVNELSMLCDIDAGLLMFSPSGRLTCVTSPGSKIEDIFLRFINEPDGLHAGTIEHVENLYRKLKHSKYEAEMLELIKTKETLQKKLDLLNRHLQIAGEKMRFYQPDVMKITSVYEAEEQEKYLTDAIQRIGRMKERMQQKENFSKVARPIQPQSYGVLDQDATTEEYVNSTTTRIPSMNGNHQDETGLVNRPPQLRAGYLTNQTPWNFPPSAGFASSSTPMENFNGGQIFQGFESNLYG